MVLLIHVSILATVAKVLLSGIIVVSASEIAKQSTIVGALIVSLPITSILALTYLYLDTGDATQVADLSKDILYLILPSTALFVVLTFLLRRDWEFFPALSVGVITTIICYGIMIYFSQGESLKNLSG